MAKLEVAKLKVVDLKVDRVKTLYSSYSLLICKKSNNHMTKDELQALKIAFTFMPQAIEVNKYEYGEDYKRILEQIEFVRAVLLESDIDPDEVAGDINPGTTPNSCY